MSSSSGTLSTSRPFSSMIVGNGARLPVTHAADTIIPTSSQPLNLHNVLVSPSLVKNLVSVHQLTRDNNISIEFDPSGFSIKDLNTKVETIRCKSTGDLYPLPQAQSFTTSMATSVELWHLRLGHPDSRTLSQVLSSFEFSCNKSVDHSCQSCRLGKHVRLPFTSSEPKSFFPFQLIHSDVWTSPVLSNSGINIMLCFWMMSRTMFGRSPLELSLTSYPSSVPFTHTYRLSFVFPWSPCKLTMAVSTTLLLSVLSSPLMASPCVSPAPIRPSKMARRNACCERSMTVCGLC